MVDLINKAPSQLRLRASIFLTSFKSIDEDEKLMETILTSGQNRQMWFLTEDGLYEVLMQSRKPIAKQFKFKNLNK